MEDFYAIGAGAGARIPRPDVSTDRASLDRPAVRSEIVDFFDGRTTRVTFLLEGIHCVACVWLLENLPRLAEGIEEARVHFSTRRVSIRFQDESILLSEVVELLDRMGYPPTLKLDQGTEPAENGAIRTHRGSILKVGVAGFAFGNTMLFSLAGYMGLESGSSLRVQMAWLSLIMCLPVVLYSAQDYWTTAWNGLKARRLTIEVPIVMGLLALFGQSLHEVLTGRGEGYADSLTGLVFFLLLGKAFQRKTYDRLSFDRDYRAFFPLITTRLRDGMEEPISLQEIQEGDRLLLRHGDLVPTDCHLVRGEALMDYSFVTGESRPVSCQTGDLIHAGGRQLGGRMEVDTTRKVSESYLASLWHQATPEDKDTRDMESVTNRFSPYFTTCVVLLALGSALYWAIVEPGLAIRSFTAVLIVACPCALALAAPFALGTAQRLMGKFGVYLKRSSVLEDLAAIDTIVFDKTGTLTDGGEGNVRFMGRDLDEEETRAVHALALQSSHPCSRQVASHAASNESPVAVDQFHDESGKGVQGLVLGRKIQLGSARWFQEQGIEVPSGTESEAVHLALDGIHRGCYALEHRLRPHMTECLRELQGMADLMLLTGDTPREQSRMEAAFGQGEHLHFQQSPHDKQAFVRDLRAQGRRVLMVGDGLNDAGALRAGNVGMAVLEDTSRFSPASDVILDAGRLQQLPRLLHYARHSVQVVRICLAISVLYNLVGVSFAARGMLSPVFCAILMPLSSISVVGIASGLAAWAGRFTRLGDGQELEAQTKRTALDPLSVAAGEGGAA